MSKTPRPPKDATVVNWRGDPPHKKKIKEAISRAERETGKFMSEGRAAGGFKGPPTRGDSLLIRGFDISAESAKAQDPKLSRALADSADASIKRGSLMKDRERDAKKGRKMT